MFIPAMVPQRQPVKREARPDLCAESQCVPRRWRAADDRGQRRSRNNKQRRLCDPIEQWRVDGVAWPSTPSSKYTDTDKQTGFQKLTTNPRCTFTSRCPQMDRARGAAQIL